MVAESKRQNFNISPEQESELDRLRITLRAATTKDAILRAVRLVSTILGAVPGARGFYIQSSTGEMIRLILPEFDIPANADYQFLVARPHPWRRQLFVKGRKLLASTVAEDMVVNERSLAETAANWNLPVEAVTECLQYTEANLALVEAEHDEQLLQMRQAGVVFGPSASD